MKSDLSPRAKDDILRQFRYYLLQDAEDAAFRFLDAVDGSTEMIRSMPEIGAPKPLRNPALAGLRFWPVKHFENILIYYLFTGDAVLIVRVLHGKRDVNKILEREKPESGHEALN